MYGSSLIGVGITLPAETVEARSSANTTTANAVHRDFERRALSSPTTAMLTRFREILASLLGDRKRRLDLDRPAVLAVQHRVAARANLLLEDGAVTSKRAL